MTMTKTLRRIELLEQHCLSQTDLGPRFTIVVHCPPQETTLRNGERAVLDIYRASGFVEWARERITTDPNDHGQSCQPGGFLLPVIEELHHSCEYRLRNECCNDCAGTPVCSKAKDRLL